MQHRSAALFVLVAAVACGYSAPDEVINGQAVATAPKATDWNFKQYETFAIGDTIVVHDYTTGTEKITEVDSSPIAPTIASNMQARGYLPAPAGAAPDLVVGLSAYKGSTTYGGYYCDWYYWSYYYYCGDYYYGTYTYGTLLLSMGDRKNATGEPAPTMQTIWGGAIYNVLGTTPYNTSLAISGINRAFAQSPYVTNK